MATIPIVYTLTNCPTCEDLRLNWGTQGIEFEERPVDKGQEWLDEALTYGSSVPIAVHPDGHVEIGFAGEVG